MRVVLRPLFGVMCKEMSSSSKLVTLVQDDESAPDQPRSRPAEEVLMYYPDLGLAPIDTFDTQADQSHTQSQPLLGSGGDSLV